MVLLLADSSTRFGQIRSWLAEQPGVGKASKSLWISRQEKVDESRTLVGEGEGCCFEWYAEADLTVGESVSFGLELSWWAGQWTVESSCRRTSSAGEIRLLELPTRSAVDVAGLVYEMNSQLGMLWAAREQTLALALEID